MISKDIVTRIIAENSKRKFNDKTEWHAGEGIHLRFDKERKELQTFIASLSDDDIIDLCALMGYGREMCTSAFAVKGYGTFQGIRNEFAEMQKNQTKENIASYLLSKGEKLSEWLLCALELY